MGGGKREKQEGRVGGSMSRKEGHLRPLGEGVRNCALDCVVGGREEIVEGEGRPNHAPGSLKLPSLTHSPLGHTH